VPIAAPVAEHQITVAQAGPAQYVVSAAGVLDGDAARLLRDALYPLAAVESAYVVVDLGAAAFVDRPSVGVVEGAAKLVSARGGALVVITRDPRVRTLLALNGSRAMIEDSLRNALDGV
jgi:anti-anti-sigma factor